MLTVETNIAFIVVYMFTVETNIAFIVVYMFTIETNTALVQSTVLSHVYCRYKYSM
jgi:hypothetical protein